MKYIISNAGIKDKGLKKIRAKFVKKDCAVIMFSPFCIIKDVLYYNIRNTISQAKNMCTFLTDMLQYKKECRVGRV